VTDSAGYRHGRYARRAIARVEQSLAGTLEPGETVESACFAHLYVPGLTLLLALGTIGDILYLLIARPYYVALTGRRFFLLNGSRWTLVSKPRDPVFSAPADSVRMDDPRRFLIRKVTTVRQVGGAEVRIAVQRGYWGELDHMRSLLFG
jgi:hypothetical protein